MAPRGEKRQAVLDAALKLFADRGFHGTSVPDVAKQASVGAGTIYRHFESKEALVNVLFREWKQKLAQDIFLSVPTDLSWRARFRETWVRMFQFAEDNPGVIEFLDLQFHSDYLDQQSRLVELQASAAFLMFAESAKREEVIVDMPSAAIVGMVYSAFLGLYRGAATGYYTLDDDLIAQAEERVWAMIRR